MLAQLRPEEDYPLIEELLQSPLIPEEAHASEGPSRFIPQKNGLVDTILRAYNDHHALVLRPDDIWLSILTQFNLFLNGPGRAEQLRKTFVAHEGRKKLVIVELGTRYTADFGALAQQMTRLIDENLVDPTLRQWIIPDFTTTTQTDRIAASGIMMATFRQYFEYQIAFVCGLPLVTLLGERNDWEALLGRIEKLNEYGPEARAWYRLLRPVLTRFVHAFDNGYTESEENRQFWQNIVHYGGVCVPRSYLSGWVTAFNVFNVHGKWIGGDLVSVSGITSSAELKSTRRSLATTRIFTSR